MIIVFGASGLLGSTICNLLKSKKKNILVLVNLNQDLKK